MDRQTVDDFKLLPYKGYAEEHELVLDLGDLSRSQQVQLLMTAWIDYADSTANFKASQSGASAGCPVPSSKEREGKMADCSSFHGISGRIAENDGC